MSDSAAWRQRTLALAALIQAVGLVDQVARTGQADPEAMEASIDSLFAFSSDNAEQAFQGVASIEFGLRGLRDLLSGNDYAEKPNILRYAMGVLYLQKKLRKNRDMMDLMASRLQHAAKKKEFSNSNDIIGLCGSLSSIYQDTLSNFSYRLQIRGSAQQLQDSNNAAKIRALLLAAVRAAFLWRQAGGSRWVLLLQRRRIFDTAKELLSTEIRH
ncbi:high frequency lysogenization protein HflD [Spongiibacter taiwanensis]|uniref:high frequency lysogenization protein HflD n=1 Tax=Spongiibacter taiwanensis TaxID=1748242 RepID=UPI00203658B6|nr:high frequency lysogenization protein HflD [Spongiibacter taiwanensis]USA43456.1 high frequency lysogenization protein HflD [Spongiibacter taiwanensis]